MLHQCRHCTKQFDFPRKTRIYCSLLCSNRHNLNNKNTKVALPQNHNAELAELFGILLGDGSVTEYYSKIFLNAVVDRAYAPKVLSLCKKLFRGATISGIARPSKGTYDIQISSKAVSSYLFQLGFNPKIRSVPVWIKENISFTKATIRGLVDTEGCVGLKYYSGKSGNYVYAQLTFTNSNKNLLEFVQTSLERLGYRPTKQSRKNIYISSTRDIDRYMKEIGSSNPKNVKKLKKRLALRSQKT